LTTATLTTSGTAVLPPQDPLYALDQLAEQVKASGVERVSGEVVIDARLFESYRVPNQNLLITPMMLNENQIDVTLLPTEPAQPARLTYRPEQSSSK
jgi:D-alanyl-D-alanine carboxypeptidase/D-alanyl-D-alanine-endopeptidase (penicillin-binding protein 4)